MRVRMAAVALAGPAILAMSADGPSPADGDPASLSATYSLSPAQVITSP